MGWRERFDPARIKVDQIRERAKRLRDIRSLGQQVTNIRQAGMRGEFLVPIIALLILAAALGLSALSPTPLAETTPTSVPVAASATSQPDTTAVAINPDGSGYPSTTTSPVSTDISVPDFEPTPDLTATTTLSDTAVAINDGAVPGYPGPDEPQPVDPAGGGMIPPPPVFPPDNSSGGTIPLLPPPPVASIPTPDLIATPYVPPYNPPSGGSNNGSSGSSGGSSGGSNSGSYPPPVQAQPTPEPPIDADGSTNPTPEPPLAATPDTGTPEPGTPAATTATTPELTPTDAVTSTPTATPVPPTPTAPPADVLTGNLRWTLADSPKVLNKNTVLAPGSFLTIDPGVEVRLGPNVQLGIGGTLRAQGSPEAPVRMVGSAGRWDGLVGTNGSTIVLDNVQLRQAGSAGTALSSTGGSLVVRNSSLADSGGGIVALGSAFEMRSTQISGNAISGTVVNVQLAPRNPTIMVGNIIGGNGTKPGSPQVLLTAVDTAGPLTIEGNSIFGGNGGAGLIINTNTPLAGTIRCNGFQGGTVGLQLSAQRPDASGFNLAIDNNAFAGQTTYGATGTVAFNLTNNWWGDPSGPQDTQRNAQGRGVPVGVNLLFQPWLTTRPGCAPSQ